MKTKSSTRKKSAKPTLPPELKEISDVKTRYIKYWTNQELGRLHQTERVPICLPTNTGYRVGLYTLTVHKNKNCEVFDPNNESIHTFSNKVTAILYTIHTIKKRYNSAWELLSLDREINKNYADMMAMKHSQTKARAKKDYETVDIRQARLEIAEEQLELAKDKISKIHLHAKYNKVWL